MKVLVVEMREMINKIKSHNNINEQVSDEGRITYSIKHLINKFHKEYGTSCNLINHGSCDTFAEELFDFLKTNFNIVGEILSDGLFYDSDNREETDENVDDYGNKPSDFNIIGLPSHYWFYYNGKHYDSDAPQGVIDMFELPIIRKWYKDKRGLSNIKKYNGK